MAKGSLKHLVDRYRRLAALEELHNLDDEVAVVVLPLDRERGADALVPEDRHPVAVGALPDAGLLTAMSDTTVLVVQTGSAAYPVVQRAAEAIGPDRIIGVVLNMVAPGELDDTYGEVGVYADTNALQGGAR